MPRKSSTEHVRKRCDCVKWKTCQHPWYLDYQEKNVRFRDNLDKLIGYHAADFTEAKGEARRAIQAKLDGRDPAGLVPADDPTMTELLDAYLKERPRSDMRQAQWQIGRLLKTELRSPTGMKPFGQWRASAVTTETLREFRRVRPVVAGNRDLALLRAAFNLAILDGLIPRSPFRVGDVNAVKFGREDGRTRRLHPGEEENLLAHARGGWWGDLILAALETGCRQEEILSLQWHQVRFSPKAELFLPAHKTKAKKDRRVPISTVLRRVLDARRADPAGEELPPNAHVFGDELGRPKGFSRRAWDRLVLLAHGHAPGYVPRLKEIGGKLRRVGQGAMAAESREVLRAINLHFHDLRREAGSRWMDAGVPLATIQRWLGHHNISQTSIYLGASIGGDEQDMEAFETRIGRVAAVTYSDVKRRQTPPNRSRSVTRTSKKPNKNRIRPEPVGTVH